MTYSRKGRLLFRGATFAVAAAFVAYTWLFHPSRDLVPYLMGAMVILVLVLATRAFLYLDEIERARKMRINFYGAMLGMGAAPLILVCILLQPSILDAAADTLHRHGPHLPQEYFVIGMMSTIIAQAFCALLVSLVLRLKPGA